MFVTIGRRLRAVTFPSDGEQTRCFFSLRVRRRARVGSRLFREVSSLGHGLEGEPLALLAVYGEAELFVRFI